MIDEIWIFFEKKEKIINLNYIEGNDNWRENRKFAEYILYNFMAKDSTLGEQNSSTPDNVASCYDTRLIV